MEAVSLQLPKIDKYSCFKRLKALDWSQINVDGHTSDESKLQLAIMVKKIRHIRTLPEVLDDVKAVIEKGPCGIKPQSAFSLFCKFIKTQNPNLKGKNFFKEASIMFKALSAGDRAVYEREADNQKKTYEVNKKLDAEKKIDQRIPTPFLMYCKQQMAEGQTSKWALVVYILLENSMDFLIRKIVF